MKPRKPHAANHDLGVLTRSRDQLATTGDEFGQAVYGYGTGLDNPLEIIRNDTIVLVPYADFRGQYFTSTDLQDNEHCDPSIF